MPARIRHLFPPVFAMIAVCALLANTAAGTTYYVRKTGNNSNNGTSAATAFLTIDKAANVALAGDTVYVGAGVYNESVTPSHDGTAVAPIAFIADTTGVNTGDAGNVDLTKSGGNAFNISGDSYIQLNGFRIYSSNNAINISGTTGSVIQNCLIYSNTTDGIKCNNAVTVSIINCSSYSNGGYGVDVQGTSSVTITNCTLRNNANAAHTDDANSGLTLLKCRIYSNTNRAILGKKGTITAKNCLIYSNGGEGIYAETTAPTITVWNCTISDNTLDGLYQTAGTVTITNSILAYNGGAGIHYTAGTLTHTYNLLYNNTGGAYSGTSGSTGELTSNPNFINKATADYHPNTGSPAINHGTNASGIVDDDLDGVARPINAVWDIGCYESSLSGNSSIRITKWLEIP